MCNAPTPLPASKRQCDKKEEDILENNEPVVAGKKLIIFVT